MVEFLHCKQMVIGSNPIISKANQTIQLEKNIKTESLNFELGRFIFFCTRLAPDTYNPFFYFFTVFPFDVFFTYRFQHCLTIFFPRPSYAGNGRYY